MTVFWMQTIFDFAGGNIGHSVETINEMITKFEKNYPLRYYSKEILFSDEARAQLIEPDLQDETAKVKWPGFNLC